jgi:hypothetical protein
MSGFNLLSRLFFTTQNAYACAAILVSWSLCIVFSWWGRFDPAKWADTSPVCGECNASF